MEQTDIRKRTDLCDKDIDYLENICDMLPMMADLEGCDLFIDCMQRQDGRLYVAAQAAPCDLVSSYSENIVGRIAEKEKEPAIYHAMELGLPMRDIKAVTQENKTVFQNAVPIFNGEGSVIGILIAERDISADIQKEKKLENIEKQGEQKFLDAVKDNSYMSQELYHRVKNHLQLIVSVMNVQIRKSQSEEVRSVLEDDISRILNISSFYELLMNSGEDKVSLWKLVEKMKQNVNRFGEDDCVINVSVEGEDILLSQSKAADVAMVVNELLTNACKHAFVEKRMEIS